MRQIGPVVTADLRATIEAVIAVGTECEFLAWKRLSEECQLGSEGEEMESLNRTF